MPLDDAPQIRIKDRIFQALFRLVGREPQTLSILHRVLLTASQLVVWDGKRSRWAKGDEQGRLELAPITVGVAAPVEATVLLTDGFEGAFNWEISGTGTDYEGERRSESAFQGDYGLYLRTRLTGAAAGDELNVKRRVGLYAKRGLVFRLRFNPLDTAATRYIEMILEIADETGIYHAILRRDEGAGVWQYRDSAGAFQTIPGLPTYFDYGYWYALELEVDCKDHLYGKLRFLGQEIDLSNLQIYRLMTSPHARRMTIIFTFTAETADRPRLHIDDLLIREIP